MRNPWIHPTCYLGPADNGRMSQGEKRAWTGFEPQTPRMFDPSQSGLENVLVLRDVFSKYSLALPTWDQRAATVVRVRITK